MDVKTKLIIYVTISMFLHNSFTNSCEIYHFVKEEGKTFVNHVIKTMSTSLEDVCWNACVWLPRCFSINVRRTNWGTVECDLNNSSKRASPGNLVSMEGTDYHEIGEVNTSNHSPYEVKRKEALGNGWYRYGQAALKLFKDLKTWLDARSYCQSLGGDLVSISSDQENDFIYNMFVKDIINNTNGDNLLGGIAQWRLDGTDRDIKLTAETGELRYEVVDGRGSLYFSGGRAFAEVPAVPFTSKAFTILFWVRIDQPLVDFSFIYTGHKNPCSFLLWSIMSKQSIRFSIKPASSSSFRTEYISVEYGVWMHIAIRWSGTESATTLEVAIDGVIKDTTNVNKGVLGINTQHVKSNRLGIMENQWANGVQNSFKGHISDIKMLNRKLSIDEIRKYYTESLDIADLSITWIGLNRSDHTSQFSWSDSSPRDGFTSVMMSPHVSQSASNQHCAATGHDGQWFGKHCLEKKPFICEKPAE